MNELTGGTVRGLPVPADLKAAEVDGARLAYTPSTAPERRSCSCMAA